MSFRSLLFYREDLKKNNGPRGHLSLAPPAEPFALGGTWCPGGPRRVNTGPNEGYQRAAQRLPGDVFRLISLNEGRYLAFLWKR